MPSHVGAFGMARDDEATPLMRGNGARREWSGRRSVVTHVAAFAFGVLGVVLSRDGVKYASTRRTGSAEQLESDSDVIRNVFACPKGMEPRCAPAPIEIECGENEHKTESGCEPCPSDTPWRCPVNGELPPTCSAHSKIIAEGTLKTHINQCANIGNWTGCDCDLTGWDVSQVQTCKHLFEGQPFRNFNEDVSAWDTSSCTTMKLAFAGAWSFNQPIGSWNAANVQDFFGMFSNARALSQDLSSWDLSAGATNTQGMFWAAKSMPRTGIPSSVRNNNNVAPSSGDGRCCYV